MQYQKRYLDKKIMAPDKAGACYTFIFYSFTKSTNPAWILATMEDTALLIAIMYKRSVFSHYFLCVSHHIIYLTLTSIYYVFAFL